MLNINNNCINGFIPQKRVKKSSSSSSSSSDEAISPTQSRKQLHAIVRKTTMEVCVTTLY